MGEMEQVRRWKKGSWAFLGMLGGLLYHFGELSRRRSDHSSWPEGAFVALHHNVKLPYVLIAGGILSSCFWVPPCLFADAAARLIRPSGSAIK